MSHHFRTIEAFVQLLEANKLAYRNEIETAKKEGEDDMFSRGAVSAYSQVLDILRASNIGIVYPPPEPERKLVDAVECGYQMPLGGLIENHPFTPRGDIGCLLCSNVKGVHRFHYQPELPPFYESNGTRCSDCGLLCDPATGSHTCSDGQVRGFRVSP